MKKCVLFIHGLGSNSKETWSDLLGKINTIKNNGDNYPKYRNYDFHVFDYSSEKTILKNFWKNLAKGVIKNLLSIDLEEDKISRIVGLLKTELEGNKYNIYNEIIVIAHSMGGVVLADYLLGLVRHNSMPIIKKILFLGTPFFGSAFASIASISGIATYETKLLKTNSEYLRNLLEDFEKYNFEDYFTCIYAFGTEDTIINPYYKSLRFSNTKWLRGDHSSMIQNQHLDNNYETIEKFIFDLPFYEKIISSNTLPIELCKNRPIEYEKIRENFYFGNSITDLLSAEDKEIYIQLYRAIDLHSFNPNQNYMGNDIYVEQKDNINSLENFYYQIKRNKSYPPFFYIGKPGSGKTLTQNVFLSRKYEDMQNDNNKIIHIRCDVHKIYDMIRGGYAKGIMIRNYLDIQFLYIFLKYRDKKYNNKKGRDNKIGITSKLMKTLDGILNVYKESRFDDDQNKDIFSGYENRFKNLGEFLEEQSKIIYHHEVDLRKDELPKRNNYSYALNVIMSGGDFKDSDDAGKNFIRKKSEAREYIRTIFLRNELENVDELLKSEQLKYFWMDSIDTEYMKSRIAEIIAHIYNLERSIEFKSNYFIIEIEDLLREQTAPKSKMANLWIKVSIQLQNIAKANGFRFLKMIDGIDNLVIRDNEREKKFYHDKIRELNSILEAEKIYEFYWITLRDDTFSYLQFENPKASYLIGDPLHDIVPIPYKYHHQFNKCLVEINDKRINYINRYFTKNNSLYKSIIEYVYAHNDRFKETIIFNNNLREILHNRQFMSLQIFFEFLRKGMSWDKEYCEKRIDDLFVETIFLRYNTYLMTGSVIKGETSTEDFDKVFPNIFQPYHTDDPAHKFNMLFCLCGVRILQLLSKQKEKGLTREQIIYCLSVLYDEALICEYLDSFMNYYILQTQCVINKDENRDESAKINYILLGKGQTLLSYIRSNINVLYYLCLDTPMPEEYIYNEYIKSHQKKPNISSNTGYGNAVIITVTTFVSVIYTIHEIEFYKLSENKKIFDGFEIPLDLNVIDESLKKVYRKDIRDNSTVNKYFCEKKIGGFRNEIELHRIMNW